MTRTTTVSARTGTTPALSPLGLVALLFGVLLPPTDYFIVTVALPTIETDLRASESMLELVVSGYGVAFALLLVVAGRLGDLIGRRRLFLVGIAAFTATSLLCGLATSGELLVAARIAQGASAAAMLPQVLATIQATTSGPTRARAMGLYAATAGMAASLGLVVGGALVAADIVGTGWRPIFLINVPIGIGALVLAVRTLPETRSPQPMRIDVPGTTLLAAAVITLLVPLTEGRVLGWPAWSWILLAVSPAALAALVVVSRSTERSGEVPLIPPSLVRLPSMWRGLAIAGPFFAGFGAFVFSYSLLAQQGLGASALEAGLGMLPLTATFFGASLITARLIQRFGRSVITAGAVIQAVGTVVVASTVALTGPDVTVPALVPGMMVLGLGQGLVVSPLYGTILSDVGAERAGVGSGLLTTTQQMALALGVAVFGSLFLELAESVPMHDAFSAVLLIQLVTAVWVAVLSRRLPG